MKYDIEIINIFKHDIRVHGFDFCNGQIEQIKDAIFRYEMRNHLHEADKRLITIK